MADDLPQGAMDLIDNYLPGLPDAIYRLSVDQTLSVGTLPQVSREFEIAGPRFAIDPADIFAQFPPPGHSGAFTEVLPHIVLTKRLLPWERVVDKFEAETPWVALLVFEDGELLGIAPGDCSEAMPVAELLTTETGVRGPAIDLDTVSAGELAMRCRVISMRSDTFAAVLPTMAELPFLAHARAVDTSGKPRFDLKDAGLFSVAVANRFPAPGAGPHGAKTIVHLVSLEGFGALLTGASPVSPLEAIVRMVSLASWTFSCLPDSGQTFAGLASHLAYDDGGSLRPLDELRLRPPIGTSTGAGAARLREGFVALGYHARTGDEDFAWYRGPLSPVVVVDRAQGPFITADAAAIFDPALGLFDHSLSAAWRAGNTAALASKSFATLLMRLRTRAASAIGLTGLLPAAATRTAAAAALVGVIPKVLTATRDGTPPTVRARSRNAPGSPRYAALRDMLSAAPSALASELTDDPDLALAATWLSRICLLGGLPFNHLVADSRALPPESARFAFVDPNWISAALDGALAIGIATSRDLALQQALTGSLKEAAAAAAQVQRATALGLPVPPPAAVRSALLIRSALIGGWPGVIVEARLQGAPMALLRAEILGTNVLLCMFNGVPDQVTVTEPHEGLAFGVDENGNVTTRTMAGGVVTSGAGVKIYDPQHNAFESAALRSVRSRVLNVRLARADTGNPDDLVGMLSASLSIAAAALTPADFALQMIKGPEQLVFSADPPAHPRRVA